MKRITHIAALGALIAASAFAIAQPAGYTGPSTKPAAAADAKAGAYAGPSSVPLMSAKDLLAKGKDEQAVKLKGRLLSHKGDDEYEFADQSGKITVEIDPKL